MDSNYKRILKLILIINAFTIIYSAKKCDRTPEGHLAAKSPADARFRLRITGNPERYTPGEVYTISLAGIRSIQTQHKFSGFLLVAEKENQDVRTDSDSTLGTGSFQLYSDALAKFSDKCANAVTHTSVVPKNEIQVMWTAPPAGSGCIAFRATVIEHREVWYMDDGPLSKVFCEDEQDSVDSQPQIQDPCCACHEAKYELTFEGLWSRHTHPKDFPSNEWLTRFSDIIGASHTVEYRFWDYGQLASDGVRQVAEHGSTRQLETELKSESDNIRTIIKARGVSYPNVTGKTFAVFRVDPKHHLVSLVSMIDPSPDWIVGVSGLELCLENCTWVEHKVLNLYPWDAGTDSGPTYIAPDQPTNPRESIRRIRPNYPNDNRSPFYDATGAEMKPFARLNLSRQRLYEKTCEEITNADDENANHKACETGSWSNWSECNVHCGKGKRHRQRSYLDPSQALQMGCKKKLTQRELCYGASRSCSMENEDIQEVENTDPECKVTDWSAWSSCSAKCGRGTRTRSRKYINRRAIKKCQRGPNPAILEENDECFGTNCLGDIHEAQSVRQRNDSRCRTTDWSTWSSCSLTCGVGKKIRTRMFLNWPNNKRNSYSHYLQRNGDSNEDNDDNNLSAGNDTDDICGHVKLWEEVECGEGQVPCNNNNNYEPPNFCFLEPKVGNCRSATTNRWYFDNNITDCAVFSYHGCNGNKNNFLSREDCLATCKPSGFAGIPIRDQTRVDYQQTNSNNDNVKTNKNNYDTVDCKISNWERGPCNVTCGYGYRVKRRQIIVQAKNGGTPCPRKLVRYERCEIKCNLRDDINPSWGPATRIEPEQYDCDYSDWSPWSPCSKTCGYYSVQQRTRHVLNGKSSNNCPHRLEERPCNVMPCLLH